MADSINVTFGGLERLAFDLANAGTNTTRMAGTVLTKAARDVERISKQLVPVDTSATQNSIGVDDRRSNRLEAVIGPTTEYAPYLELGTANMGPRAFMGPAADLVGPSLTAAMAAIGVDALR